ncbi:acetate/propionate family kinase [Variovorax sp. J22P168]|uniref:acetate/propionate family kinase n=1 Tax=Variovorax jilinensis TaxID=3053513 RepID=UPI002577FD5F|nr:acetate/propionate family kinase [Variovorax sp. J22P168]MDM0014572.1 acetate/propionate family kinase [Variovorax sp. J22P168]
MHNASTSSPGTATASAAAGDMVAVANAGSSSLKFSLYALRGPEGLELVMRGLVEGLDTAPEFSATDAAGRRIGHRAWGGGASLGHDAALHHAIGFVRELVPGMVLRGVGHRVVHGGPAFARPVVVTPEVLQQLEALTPLAPLHQPNNLSPIRLAFEALPGVPQVACFDTAFHRDNPELAQMFALPFELFESGVRRYGFHGLSYEYIASRLPALAPQLAAGRVVVLHLGNGASACALKAGRSVASSMSFSALDGLPMGTRCGAIDAGVLLYLMQERGMDAKSIERLLYKESGLLGVSGESSDMRALRASTAPRARLAIELMAYRIVREIGSLAAAMGGLDGVVFTAGIGEHDAELRRRVIDALGWLGLTIDEAANAAGGPRIDTGADGRCSAWVVPTDEESMIARHTLALLQS